MRTDWTVPLAAASIATLAAMASITAVTGVSQETFEIVRDPDVYAAALRDHATVVRAVFALDTVFLVLYSALFLVFARRIATPATRAMIAVGVGALLATAVLDMIEDHHILAMLAGVEVGDPPGAARIGFQHTLSQVKFNVSYLGQFLVGLAVPRVTWAGKLLAVLLTVGTVVQGAWLYAAPPHLLSVGNAGRWGGFVLGFALVIVLVRQQDRSAAPTPDAAATATGAPA